MAYTTTQLITNAYYLSGVEGRGLNTVSGDEITDGLNLLNALIAFKTANNRLIPYYKNYEINAVVNQEMYFIPQLVSIEAITFNLQTIRFSMFNQSRKRYFGTARVNNISALPFDWHLERTLGGANIFLYYLPQDNYPINIFGKFSLSSVMQNQDLSLTLDAFYIEYLRLALAEYICADYNITLQPQAMSKLNEYEEMIEDISPIDLSLTKTSTLQDSTGINWGYVNFPGWTP